MKEEPSLAIPIDMKMIIKEYSEQLHAHKSYHLDYTDYSLRGNLLKLTQGETGNLNRTTSIKEIKSIINLPKH